MVVLYGFCWEMMRFLGGVDLVFRIQSILGWVWDCLIWVLLKNDVVSDVASGCVQ